MGSSAANSEFNINNIATSLNEKAEIDFVNVTDAANIKMAHNAMPSNTYIDLTLGTSGTTYTAPADGWIKFGATSSTNGSWLHIGARVDGFCLGVGTGQGMYACCPVAKNEVVTITYSNISPTSLKFIYAVGSESEAE